MSARAEHTNPFNLLRRVSTRIFIIGSEQDRLTEYLLHLTRYYGFSGLETVVRRAEQFMVVRLGRITVAGWLCVYSRFTSKAVIVNALQPADAICFLAPDNEVGPHIAKFFTRLERACPQSPCAVLMPSVRHSDIPLGIWKACCANASVVQGEVQDHPAPSYYEHRDAAALDWRRMFQAKFLHNRRGLFFGNALARDGLRDILVWLATCAASHVLFDESAFIDFID